jgi:hypothetical protein
METSFWAPNIPFKVMLTIETDLDMALSLGTGQEFSIVGVLSNTVKALLMLRTNPLCNHPF